MPDTTPTAAPTIAYLWDDVGTEQGQVRNGQMTDDANPVAIVQLPGATPSTDAPQAGDTVTLLENGAAIGHYVLTATDVAQGFADVFAASGLSTAQSQTLQAQITDVSGNASALSPGFTVDLAPGGSGMTRTNLTDGGYVLSYSALGGPAQTHLQRYDAAGEPVGAEIDYTGFGFYSGSYTVTPLAGGSYLALFFSGPHYGGTSGDIVAPTGDILPQHPSMSGQAHAVAGPAGGFVIYGTLPFQTDGFFTLYNNEGVAESGQLELAGPITSVTPGAGNDVAITWNDAGVLRTLSVDPRFPSALSNPTAVPTLTVFDDAGPQTGPVPNGGATDDTTPSLHIAVSQTGEAYVQLSGPNGPVTLTAVQVSAADVARGYAEVTPSLADPGLYLVNVRTSDANGLVSPSSQTGFFVEGPGQTLQGQAGGSSLQGGPGDDTLISGTGPDTMTGAEGADHFVFNAAPWSPGHVTDFTPGADKLDLSVLLAGAHYAGSDPIADGYVKLVDDGQGDSWLYFDSDGRGSGDVWGSFVTTLDHVAPGQVAASDLIGPGGGPPPSPPPPGVAGQVMQGAAGGSDLIGGSGDDTLIGGTGPDVMTGAAGADKFVFTTVPWRAAEITDFTHGADKLDLSGLLSAAHYTGSDPVAEGYVKFLDNGSGGTWLYFDSDGRGSADPWGSFVATFDHVAAASFTTADLASSEGIPSPPPPPAGGQTLYGQGGGSSLTGASGDDTLIGGTGPDTMTGGGGADHFVWSQLPWSGGQVTDFTHGVDRIDISGLLAGVHYAGADPVADGYVKLIDDGHGDTWLYFDTDGRGSADPWGTFVASLKSVSPASFSNADFIF